MRTLNLDAISVTGVGMAAIASYLAAKRVVEELVDEWLVGDVSNSEMDVYWFAIDSYVWGYVECQLIYFRATCTRETYEVLKNDPL
jgi:hypothetical protein